MAKDPVLGVIKSIGDTFIAPVKVAAEIVANGDASDETLSDALKSNFRPGDLIDVDIGDTDKK